MRYGNGAIVGGSTGVLHRVRLTLALAATLVLAACGSTSKTGASSSGAASPSGGSASSAKTEVMASNGSKFGAVLTDARGLTLYTLTNAGRPVACTGRCATLWPPLLLPAGIATPTGARGVSGLGVVSMNGGMQVTDKGDPLYRFSGDQAPGDTNGEGRMGFGGVWHAAKASAAASGDVTYTTAPPTTTGSGGGYGY